VDTIILQLIILMNYVYEFYGIYALSMKSSERDLSYTLKNISM
jgi:hypothetical protein